MQQAGRKLATNDVDERMEEVQDVQEEAPRKFEKLRMFKAGRAGDSIGFGGSRAVDMNQGCCASRRAEYNRGIGLMLEADRQDEKPNVFYQSSMALFDVIIPELDSICTEVSDSPATGDKCTIQQ